MYKLERAIVRALLEERYDDKHVLQAAWDEQYWLAREHVPIKPHL